MALISVIVPVYKVEAYLHRCVDSILSQSFSDFDLILVDDGSPDGCGRLCDAYEARDSRVHVIHQENGGLSAARNAGIEWALRCSDSQWIAFVDSDDWVHEDYLRLLYKAVSATGCRISACGFVRTEGEALPDVQEGCKRMTPEDFYCGEEVPSGTAAIASNKLYSKSLFETVRFPVGKLHEDEFTTYRLIFAVEAVAYVPAGLYAYFQNTEGIMLSQWNPRRLHILEAIEQQMADAKRWGNERLFAKAVKHYIYANHEQLNASHKVFHKELRSKYRTALKLGRKVGVFPLCWDHLWAYEEAYPCKLLWWVLFRGRRFVDGLVRKGKP